MKTNPSSPEGRQHINLSQYAYDVVRNDSLSFLGTLNISGFINIVVENTKVDSFDDFSLMEEERILEELSNYSRSGSSVKLSESESKTIKKISAAHRYHILNSYKKYPKDIALKIRLNKKLHNELYPIDSEWQGNKHGLSQGEYIKALIEDYARKTYFERECVFFKECIDELNRYISMPDNEKRILSIIMKDNRKYYCRIYRLSEEYETHNHYIIGMFKEEENAEYNIFSIRLSRISEIKPRGRSLGSGKITQNEKTRIENRIKECSVPYLKTTPSQFLVKLTPLGMLMYDYNYASRPIYDSITKFPDGSCSLSISATERQIQNYFFAFGKEAVILKPDETHIWMTEKYSDAKNAYNYLD